MIEWFEGSRSELAELFALADDSPRQVERYRELGCVLVARDGGAVIGHLQLVRGERETEMEIKSLAVRRDRQRGGIGRSLIERAIAICRERNLSTLLVATAAADTDALRFYQRLGFRVLRVERDVFTREAGYPELSVNGVPLRDQIWLSMALDASTSSGTRSVAMQVRIARHTEQLDDVVRFYRDGLGLVEAGGFRDHGGYDGIFLAIPGTRAHLELTSGGRHGAPAPHPESLLVLYLGDAEAVKAAVTRLGREPVAPANPYWAEHGTTIADPDGFHVVLVPNLWTP